MPRCDQCQMLRINGIPTHETGCPNEWRHPGTGKPYKRTCHCGREFRPKDRNQSECHHCLRRR